MTLDVYTWSFEARSLKPDPAIYDTVCRRLQCLPQQVLMIGDTQKADVDGPRAFGMQAIRIDRRTADDNAEKISSLNGLFKLL
jgi:FMN phosphatase YigB (HAD superfamily)